MLYTAEDVSHARDRLGPLWPILRKGLWHSTTVERFSGILADGQIRPNGGILGNIYKGSFAAAIGAVSLFDFQSEEDALGTLRNWSSHLAQLETRVTIWIAINRARLPGEILSPEFVKTRVACMTAKNYYPRVEACHMGAIPADTFLDLLAICSAKPSVFERITIDQEVTARLQDLQGRWPDPKPSIVRILQRGRPRNSVPS